MSGHGLGKEAFIGTGIVSAVIVDIARMLLYGFSFYTSKFVELSGIWMLVLVATLAAFLGAFVGMRLIKGITLGAIQNLIGVLLVIIGLGMATGLL